MNEALRAHQRRAQSIDDRQQRLGAAAAPDRRRRRRSSWPCACGPCAWRARAAGAPGATSSSQGTSSAVASSPAGKLARSAAGLRRPSSRCSATTASGGAEIQLGQQHRDRRPRPARAPPRGARAARARLGVDDADDARRRRPAPPSPRPSSPSRIDQGSAMPVVSSTTTSGRAAAGHLGDRGPQLRLHAHLVTDAAARQLHHVAGAALDEARVDVDAPELVDDHADAPVVLRAQHAVQRRRLSRAQEAGQQHQRRLRDGFVVGHGARSSGYRRAAVNPRRERRCRRAAARGRSAAAAVAGQEGLRDAGAHRRGDLRRRPIEIDGAVGPRSAASARRA